MDTEPQEFLQQPTAATAVRGDYTAHLLGHVSIPGAGLAVDTPVPTPDGWANLGDLSPGQEVFDERGHTCTVTLAYPMREQSAYRVEFDDDSLLLASGRQQWMTITNLQRRQIREGTRRLDHWAAARLLGGITTEEIRDSLTHDAGGYIKSNHSIPLARALDLPQKDLPIDPYLLGLWLGDGSSAGSVIYCHRADEPYYRLRAQSAGEQWRVSAEKGNVLTCTLARGPAPQLHTRLRRLGVLGSKHVPALYLRAGMDQRLELMRGLMDSDGYLDHRGLAEYTTTSERLAQGVLELTLSLGQKASVGIGQATLNGRVISDRWRVCFSPTTTVASLPRKADRLKEALEYRRQVPFPRPMQRYIRRIAPDGRREKVCTAVDSPSRLFLAGRTMIPVLGSEQPWPRGRNPR